MAVNIREMRTRAWEEAQALRAVRENRAFTAVEQARWEFLLGRLANLDDEIDQRRTEGAWAGKGYRLIAVPWGRQ